MSRIRLAYAQTIDRSLGQTCDDVGVILYFLVFCHGQKYVALYTGRNKKRIKVVLKTWKYTWWILNNLLISEKKN